MRLEAHDTPTWGAKLVPWDQRDGLATVTNDARYDVVWSPPTTQTRIPKMGSAQQPVVPAAAEPFMRRKKK